MSLPYFFRLFQQCLPFVVNFTSFFSQKPVIIRFLVFLPSFNLVISKLSVLPLILWKKRTDHFSYELSNTGISLFHDVCLFYSFITGFFCYIIFRIIMIHGKCYLQIFLEAPFHGIKLRIFLLKFVIFIEHLFQKNNTAFGIVRNDSNE